MRLCEQETRIAELRIILARVAVRMSGPVNECRRWNGFRRRHRRFVHFVATVVSKRVPESGGFRVNEG